MKSKKQKRYLHLIYFTYLDNEHSPFEEHAWLTRDEAELVREMLRQLAALGEIEYEDCCLWTKPKGMNLRGLARELRDTFDYYHNHYLFEQEWTSQQGQCAYALRMLDAPARKAGRA